MQAGNSRSVKLCAVGGAIVAATALTLAMGNSMAEARETPRNPEKIYATVCGYCHGHNIGPVIRGRGLDADTIAYFVRNGAGAMPAFKPTEISESELAALGAWISTSEADPKEHGK